MRWKRWIYGLPIMAAYRVRRTRQLAERHRDHPFGFRFAGSETFFRADWETAERRAVLAQLTQASVFIDVGANQGIYTCLAAARGLIVAAVEPERGNLEFLRRNIAANGFAVEVFPVALSDVTGTARLFGDGDTASLVPGWSNAAESFAQAVPTTTLDGLFADRWPGEALFVKIDVEGFELAVLRGATRLIERMAKPAWLIETFPRNYDKDASRNAGFEAVFEIMFRAGYRCTRVDTGAAVSIADVRDWALSDGANLGGANFLFVAEAPTG